jgi:pimeloyl-ACP methyl ester carboxylesterase
MKMKMLKYFSVVLVMSLLVFSGCKEDDEEEEIVLKYLVDYQEYTPSTTYSVDNIKTGLTLLGYSELAAKVKYDILLYTISYKTLFEGDSIIVSGVVAVPDGSADFPIMSFQHGTLALKSDAPSLNLDIDVASLVSGTDSDESSLQPFFLASTGMVVLIPDYIGFGSSSAYFHPFMHNQYTVYAVLDMIRASKEFIATEKPCNINDDLFLYGYSQGGSATVGALSAIENDNANSDISVTAASAGGGAYDLMGLQEWIMQQTRYEQPYYIAYLLESYSEYENIDIDYSLVFSEDFADMIPGIIDGVTDGDAINDMFGTTHVGELFNDSFEDYDIFSVDDSYASIREAFDDNEIAAWSIETPLYLYYGSDDVWIPGDQTLELYQNFQSLSVGSTVGLKPLAGYDHVSSVYPSIVGSIEWFLSY